MAGIEVVDVLGSERKKHARQFVKQNWMSPQQFHTDTAHMFAEARAPGEEGYARADIFASGFPRQPFSAMRRRKDRQPRHHPLYKEFELVCKYIFKTEPKTCLLENVIAFAAEDHTEDDSILESDDDIATKTTSAPSRE